MFTVLGIELGVCANLELIRLKSKVFHSEK